jgi:hypothetical protein
VKILGGGDPAVKLWSVDFVPVPSTLLAVDIRRDLSNEAQLNTEMTIVVKDDQAAVAGVDPTLVPLPEAFYTYNAGGVTKVGGSGGTYTLVFKAGEIAKTIYITIPDATLMSTSNTYGLGFTITSVTGGNAKIGSANSIVYKIGAKNKYDGVYKDDFKNYHPTNNPLYTGDIAEVEFITTGANTCKVYWPDAGAFANPAVLAGNLTYFGSQEPAYTVNPATNQVTVQNAFAGATTFYTMNASYPNLYTPSTKSFDLKWGYSYAVPGVFDAVCREWTQKLTYLRSR